MNEKEKVKKINLILIKMKNAMDIISKESKKWISSIETFEDYKIVKSKILKKFKNSFNLWKDNTKLNPEIKNHFAFKKDLKILNEAKLEINHFLSLKYEEIKNNIIKNKKIITSKIIDYTPDIQISSLHPLNIIKNKTYDFFTSLGFDFFESSEVEDVDYNFTKLNMDENHPARDMHDTFFSNKKNKVFRTHCTASTIRYLEKNVNKSSRVFSIGNVFRNDSDDSTHSHQFMQIDFAFVSRYANIPNLKWVLDEFLKSIFGKETKTRFRSSYFPFTEPSFEVDVMMNDTGKWIEILGCGMLHPKVLKRLGFSDEYKGFAAGIGVDRLAMLKYDLREIRDLYKNDVRFLKQFTMEEY